jgi:hypothetical protein
MSSKSYRFTAFKRVGRLAACPMPHVTRLPGATYQVNATLVRSETEVEDTPAKLVSSESKALV